MHATGDPRRADPARPAADDKEIEVEAQSYARKLVTA